MTDDRRLSFWAWGYEDRLPDDEERRELAARIEGMLGFPERPVVDYPTLDDVEMPAPRIEVPDDLSEFVTADRRPRASHTYGKGYRDLVRGFHGDFSSAPDVVATPRDEDDVEAVIEWATGENVAVVPFGGGTSVVAGVECDGDGYAGVCSLDMREMDRVLEVDEHSRSARIQAGATGPEIQEQLAEYGLQLRHYPQSYEFSTFGGWVATRAGGHFATRYTHIDDFVESVRAVTPAGSLETRRLPASGAGPDPNRFLLGSEGAFGVITEGWTRVQPRPPHRARATMRFDDYWDAVEATREIVQARLYPANCRLLDSDEAMLNELAFDGSHLLLLGFESTDHPVEDDLERAMTIAEDHGGTCPDGPSVEDRSTGDVEEEREDSEEGSWRDSFFEAPYMFNALVSMGVLVDTFETAVTWDQFSDLHAALQENVVGAMREECGAGFMSCRFTHVYEDGPAPYYTLLAPAEVGSELEQWRRIKETASDTLMEHGATITHHHAVGRVHRDHYHEEVPENYLQALRSMKRTLDPDGIMNPGALL
ncbi:FAD-binding oxidoreductase [Natronomonas salina]|uniref:FAD-binding oxidoreductase n=1 Tax=Natronomonas salina TaxID=1710540 RepID=UPI0015B623B2|nr:FAD-binding oxidoreductase [Natronomonas salina]QLD87662.1 FAD-binding oxidoreductase [Natronomonas salina]